MILNGYENIDRIMFFSLKKDSRTRGHEVKLVKDQCRLDIRKYLFSHRTVKEWNKLSTDCITASNVNMFKKTSLTRFNKICHPSQRPRWQVDKEAIGLSRVQQCSSTYSQPS